MTREEKAQVIDSVLARYGDLGITLVDDDVTLCRLLTTLGRCDAEEDVGEYLYSYLAV